jgi:hypothetical protein
MVIIMFGNIFYIINAPGKGNGFEQGTIDLSASPFQSPGISLFSVFTMMFGSFDPTWFQTETNGLTAVSIGFFVCFMFVPASALHCIYAYII